MASDILSEYGRDLPRSEKPRATNGGQIDPKPMPYSPPVGPIGINDPKTPGLHGTNHGPSGGQQGRH